MKIFIAGARSITSLSPCVKQRLMSIYNQGFDILVGDCYGVDKTVQEFYNDLHYDHITVYASNGKARNNVGKWNVRSVYVPGHLRGFSFYRQKDIEMAHNADYGFMIWDGASKGTLHNIITMSKQSKKVLVYLSPLDRMFTIGNEEQVNDLLNVCHSGINGKSN